MRYLLDACVLSEFVKTAPEAKVLAWINARAENDLYVAAMSLAELRRGGARLQVICARVEAGGRTMAAFDSIIAATAVEHGLVLVTRNDRDFAAALPVMFNPWAIT